MMRCMRLVLHNPHANQCGKMVFNWLFRLPQHQKYNYLWQAALKDPQKKMAFLVDRTQSSFYQISPFHKTIGRIPFLLGWFTSLEMRLWLWLNKIPPKAFPIVTHIKDLDPKHDVVLSFGFTSFGSRLSEYSGVVLLHLSHYHHDTEPIARYFNSFQHGFLIGENDVSSNDYFRHYFPKAHSVYFLPFTYLPGRFKNIKPFEQRSPLCFASGSMSVPSSEAYVKYYGKGAALNPMREKIYKARDAVQDVMTVCIFPHDAAMKAFKEIKPTDGSFKRWAKRHLPPWLLKLLFNEKLPYFQLDIVEKYNEHQMFTSPEERTGMPSMKVYEGIVCGAALIGIDDPMYTDIGFKDGVNYIAYRDNDLEDLKEKIRYYQQRPDRLKSIAEKGLELVMERFVPEKIVEVFWKDLDHLQASFERGKPVFKSSFVTKET